jgi:serine/threonine protein kinase
MYLLGEGRYATVYLASYKKDVKGKGRSRNPYLYGPNVRVTESISNQGDGEEEMEVNEEGDGFVGGSWRLCAAKRMAPDRQSQTMGLREAFFLNRLAATVTSPIDGLPALMGGGGHPSRKTRAVSPLREGSRRESGTPSNRNGSVYVVKLVAVKEDIPPRTTVGHGRSVSDAVQEGSRGMIVRQRSSTMMNRLHQNQVPSRKNDEQSISSLNSHPSLPSLAKAAKSEIETAPALSRLVLILEHAPLGTMDRFLRTSPGLVGKKMWNRWAVQTTDALSWVHGKGIVHADIKAGNLLVRHLPLQYVIRQLTRS